LDPRARGSNQLLRDGAALIETVDDILDILNAAQSPQRMNPDPKALKETREDMEWLDGEDDTQPEHSPASPLELEPDPKADPIDLLCSLLSPTPVSVDELARQASLPIGSVQAAVLEIELRGDAVILPGGLVQVSGSS